MEVAPGSPSPVRRLLEGLERVTCVMGLHALLSPVEPQGARFVVGSPPCLVGGESEYLVSVTEDPSGASTERRQPTSREEIRQRIRREFDELGGMSLTLPQAARLFSLDHQLCERLLTELVAQGVLLRTDAGSYARAF